MRTKYSILLLSAIISFAFVLHPSNTYFLAGKTWFFHSIADDYIEFKLSKADANGNGTFIWIVGKGITDKKEGKYSINNKVLTLHYYWTGVKTFSKTYRIEHETKTGFVLIEQASGMNNTTKSFLFTSSQ